MKYYGCNGFRKGRVIENHITLSKNSRFLRENVRILKKYPSEFSYYGLYEKWTADCMVGSQKATLEYISSWGDEPYLLVLKR